MTHESGELLLCLESSMVFRYHTSVGASIFADGILSNIEFWSLRTSMFWVKNQRSWSVSLEKKPE